jgi:hypothetical protein
MKGTIKYFQMKSCHIDHIRISQKEDIWATTPKNTLKLLEAFLNSAHVILVFSVNFSRKFIGYTRMQSMPQKSLSTGHFGPMEQSFLGPCFKVKWISNGMAYFDQVGDLPNSLNNNLPVKIGRDGQELDCEVGAQLCEELDKEALRSENRRTLEEAKANKELITDSSSIETSARNKVKESIIGKKHKNEYITYSITKKKKICNKEAITIKC